MKRFPKMSAPRVLLGLLALSVVLTVLGGRAAVPVRNVVGSIIAPPADGIMYIVGPIKQQVTTAPEAPMSTAEAARLRQENQQLWAKVYSLHAQREQLKKQLTTVHGLRARFEATSDLAVEIIPARVAAEASLPYGQSPLLNAGRRDGLAAGAPVLTALLRVDRAKAIAPADAAVVIPQAVRDNANLARISGAHLVGRLIETGEFTARMQTVSDRGFQIGARIRRLVYPEPVREIIPPGGGQPVKLTAANCAFDVVTEGDGKGSLLVRDVPRQRLVRPRGWRVPGETQIPPGATRPGDVLITRSDDPSIPVEIAIGEVVEILDDPASPGFQTLRVEPFANLQALREVYIVVPRGHLGAVGGGH